MTGTKPKAQGQGCPAISGDILSMKLAVPDVRQTSLNPIRHSRNHIGQVTGEDINGIRHSHSRIGQQTKRGRRDWPFLSQKRPIVLVRAKKRDFGGLVLQGGL